MALAGCTTSDREAVADGLNMVADDMALPLTQAPTYECGLNGQRDPVCDDTGDGFADRFGGIVPTFRLSFYLQKASASGQVGSDRERP